MDGTVRVNDSHHEYLESHYRCCSLVTRLRARGCSWWSDTLSDVPQVSKTLRISCHKICIRKLISAKPEILRFKSPVIYTFTSFSYHQRNFSSSLITALSRIRVLCAAGAQFPPKPGISSCNRTFRSPPGQLLPPVVPWGRVSTGAPQHPRPQPRGSAKASWGSPPASVASWGRPPPPHPPRPRHRQGVPAPRAGRGHCSLAKQPWSSAKVPGARELPSLGKCSFGCSTLGGLGRLG